MSPASEPLVLLVDDDPHVLSALRRCLRREKVAVETAAHAQAALDFLAQTPVDLVVSDQKMPGMSGVALLKSVRAKWPQTQRILLSGWASAIPASDLEAAGLFRVLQKPWDDGELRTTIRAAVGLE